jgi:hypothetical protein
VNGGGNSPPSSKPKPKTKTKASAQPLVYTPLNQVTNNMRDVNLYGVVSYFKPTYKAGELSQRAAVPWVACVKCLQVVRWRLVC